jgi:hypothetical protein
MRRQWVTLEEFPNYEVSSLGEFVNARTDREVHTSMNQQGHAKITLSREGRLYTRSAALLVANAFLDRPEEHFDTPIHLDGDLMNCMVTNLMWRPRWFAIRYHRQFQYEDFHNDQNHRVELTSGETYHSLKEVCVSNGLYYYDVLKSCVEETFVPMTFQEFRDVPE